VEDFDSAVGDEAARRFQSLDDEQRKVLARNVTMGLPGSTESLTIPEVQAHLDEYGHISPDQLRKHFVDFLSEVVPVAKSSDCASAATPTTHRSRCWGCRA
jgi:mannonate dehydratase